MLEAALSIIALVALVVALRLVRPMLRPLSHAGKHWAVGTCRLAVDWEEELAITQALEDRCKYKPLMSELHCNNKHEVVAVIDHADSVGTPEEKAIVSAALDSFLAKRVSTTNNNTAVISNGTPIAVQSNETTEVVSKAELQSRVAKAENLMDMLVDM